MVFQRKIGLGGLTLRCGIIWAVFNIGGFGWTAYQFNQLEKNTVLKRPLKEQEILQKKFTQFYNMSLALVSN